ncbi:piggyBac transposable element-derived protein 4-like [Mercenaria mercenaria]|uniref:piggyBac transposable element-derived protein 4-like n=1 Tax=Mercenaria mercenaria TaxID=6596 RepID=UPI001E1DC36C|nr:piggyBac transposable element-derived protein 4-like [Mercenaria mercenaria]
MKEVMTCNRYQKLNQYLHVSDRATEPARNQPGYDRLYKVRPIIRHVSANFLDRYTLSREVAVDEAMVRYTGKLSFKQYMPAKPIKRGVKIWMACASNTAYLSRFDIYLGRNNNQTEHGLGYNVVRKLTDNLHGSNRHIYFDNFFTGIPLMQDLLQDGLYGCGTVRTNRKGFPTEEKKPTSVKERGQFLIMQKGNSNLTATCWKDNRLVHHLATNCDESEVNMTTRRSGPNVLALRQPSTVNK